MTDGQQTWYCLGRPEPLTLSSGVQERGGLDRPRRESEQNRRGWSHTKTHNETRWRCPFLRSDGAGGARRDDGRWGNGKVTGGRGGWAGAMESSCEN